jgi:hypothetical protein
MRQRGQAGVLVAILALVAGIVAFVVIYGMNSRQNAELANTVAESITYSEPVVEDAYMETLEHAASLKGANLTFTFMQGDTLNIATMPDGTKHDCLTFRKPRMRPCRK